MKNYFVESHHGGYYFSSMNKEDIEVYRETCGDYDTVLFEYDDEDKSEPYNSLCFYFMKDLVLSKSILEERLYAYNATERGIKEALAEIKCDIVLQMDGIKEIFISLLESNEIDKKTYTRLVKRFNKLVVKQLNFIDCFDYSQIDLERFEVKTKKKTNEK